MDGIRASIGYVKGRKGRLAATRSMKNERGGRGNADFLDYITTIRESTTERRAFGSRKKSKAGEWTDWGINQKKRKPQEQKVKVFYQERE